MSPDPNTAVAGAIGAGSGHRSLSRKDQMSTSHAAALRDEHDQEHTHA